MSDDCVFCRIVKKELPCTLVYQDEDVLTFLDINPLSEGHCLLIPTQHVDRFEHCPPDVAAALARCLGSVARAVTLAVKAPGYNILSNNGRCAGQLVDHLHFHIIPRHPNDRVFSHRPQLKYPTGRMDELAEKIKKHLAL